MAGRRVLGEEFMGLGEPIRTGFSKCVMFSGRAPRSEYWYFALFDFIASLVGNLGPVVN
jgi:uncharacterized membrane protein YhaH (DUF805 family)